MDHMVAVAKVMDHEITVEVVVEVDDVVDLSTPATLKSTLNVK